MNLASCINHPDRISEVKVCSTIARDGTPEQFCACCEECRKICLATPHGHGGTPKKEYNFRTKRCKICGMDVSKWIS